MNRNRDHANVPTAQTASDRIKRKASIAPRQSYTLAQFFRHAAVLVAVVLIYSATR